MICEMLSTGKNVVLLVSAWFRPCFSGHRGELKSVFKVPKTCVILSLCCYFPQRSKNADSFGNNKRRDTGIRPDFILQICRTLPFFTPSSAITPRVRRGLEKKAIFTPLLLFTAPLGRLYRAFLPRRRACWGEKVSPSLSLGPPGVSWPLTYSTLSAAITPPLYSKTDYVMCESSPTAVLEAGERLREHSERVRWVDNLGEITKGGFRAVVIANEFLDSLPFHRLKSDDGGIREIFPLASRRGKSGKFCILPKPRGFMIFQDGILTDTQVVRRPKSVCWRENGLRRLQMYSRGGLFSALTTDPLLLSFIPPQDGKAP